MSDWFGLASRPADGVWGTVKGVPVTDEVIDDVAKDAQSGFQSARFTPVGRRHPPRGHAEEPS